MFMRGVSDQVLLENVTVLILDDEPIALEQSQKAIREFVPENRIHCARNASEAIRFLAENPVQIIFIDVELSDTDGFSVADYVRRAYPKTFRVFLTGHTELGAKSYDYEAFDFISKPIDLFRLESTFERYCRQAEGKPKDSGRIAVETSRGFILIAPEEILYIAKEQRKTVIHCKNEAYKVPYSLEEIEAVFSEYRIIRIHNSVLAPLSHIVRVEEASFGCTYSATLDDGTSLPVSRNGYAKLREYLSAKGTVFI